MENPAYENKEVNTKFILVDRMYQREINQARVARILKEFDPREVNPPKLSFRDGKYYVFDGGHTIAALKARHGGKDITIMCRVYYGLTQHDEAVLFEKQNGIAAAVGTTAKIRSRFNRGEENAVAMVRAAESVGLTVDIDHKGKAAGRIAAVSRLDSLYAKMGREGFIDVLSIIKAAWGGSIDSLRGEIIEGVAYFCEFYRGKYSRATLIDRLSKVSPVEIIREGKLAHTGGARRYARQIVLIYNKRLQNKLDELI